MISDNPISFAGRVAIITGSGKENGIGAGIAEALARHGAYVTINYVSDSTSPRAANVVKKIEANGGKAVAVQADISTREGSIRLVDETLKAFKVQRVDILVNNAAGGEPGPLLRATQAGIERTFAIMVFGSIYMMQAAAPYMPRGGRIINIGSVASRLGSAEMPLYSTCKAAMDQLTFAVATEFGRGHGITINTIAPGPVKTDGLPPDVMNATIEAFAPLVRAEDRVGTVEDVADAVLLIASEKSRWITGQFISVSGGVLGG